MFTGVCCCVFSGVTGQLEGWSPAFGLSEPQVPHIARARVLVVFSGFASGFKRRASCFECRVWFRIWFQVPRFWFQVPLLVRVWFQVRATLLVSSAVSALSAAPGGHRAGSGLFTPYSSASHTGELGIMDLPAGTGQ